ncbi:hypothetical protein BP5796_12779 [Coleophoma crateriformis]|uniref:Heterokaryon incompatibility domain-containing protein n=1 Tax=Coleophoma crateriformis TaxID=565419 RepID=A0A3D8Q695_9HELO|nr:hypothetical protein BP5796_12779 [Coleophoma crateriformis]
MESDLYFDLHSREIRLVKLLKGQWSDELRCVLYHAPLANRPTYKALSYSWGLAGKPRVVLLNGCKHSVTASLESALRRLRQSDDDVSIWADALCINQSNNSERTRQVGLMHEIFSSAEEVIIYLGEVSDPGSLRSARQKRDTDSTIMTTFGYNDTDRDKLDIFRSHCSADQSPTTIFKSIKKIDYAFDVFCLLRCLAEGQHLERILPNDSGSQQIMVSEYQRKLFEALRSIMNARWWDRIWVIQEVIVPQNLTIVYGPMVAPWEMFVDAARLCFRGGTSTTLSSFPRENMIVLEFFRGQVLDIDRMRHLWRSGKQPALLSLLRRFSGRKATDDRDKVYALLNLASDGLSFIPDYTQDVSAVFQTTVLEIIRQSTKLNVLSGDLGRKDRQDLPSWVPDWSAAYDDLDRRRADDTENYDATHGSELYVVDENAGRWSGVREYLKPGPVVPKKDEVPSEAVERTYNDTLGTSEWTKYLVTSVDDETLSEDDCLSAIECFYTSRGNPGYLRNYDRGIVSLSGICIDKISITGEVSFSDKDLLTIVPSWAFLVKTHADSLIYHGSPHGVQRAFLRTLCADIVHTDSGTEAQARRINEYGTKGIRARRITKDDQKLICKWLLRLKDLQPGFVDHHLAIEDMFKDLGDLDSPASADLAASIDTAIRSASVRRSFFITDKGYIGLGPAKMGVGDDLYIVLGCRTPLILRRGSATPTQGQLPWPVYYVIGDCYAHGLMDGEAMETWRKFFLENETNARFRGRVHLV